MPSVLSPPGGSAIRRDPIRGCGAAPRRPSVLSPSGISGAPTDFTEGRTFTTPPPFACSHPLNAAHRSGAAFLSEPPPGFLSLLPAPTCPPRSWLGFASSGSSTGENAGRRLPVDLVLLRVLRGKPTRQAEQNSTPLASVSCSVLEKNITQRGAAQWASPHVWPGHGSNEGHDLLSLAQERHVIAKPRVQFGEESLPLWLLLQPRVLHLASVVHWPVSVPSLCRV